MANELPEGLTEAQADAWFGKKTSGRFNPNGALSQLWLGLGRFPTLEAVDTAGTREIYRFADGTVVVRPEGGAPSVLAGEGGLPAGVGAARVAGWYGTATADGHDYAFAADHPVGKLWLGLGRYPRLESVANVGEARYFRYADGTVIYRPTADTHGYRVLGENTSGGTYPDGMNKELAEQWFGEKYNETGQVSQLWLKTGQQQRRFPAYLGDSDAPDGGQFFRFADGTVLLRAAPGEEPRVFPASATATSSTTVAPAVAGWPTAEAINHRIELSNQANGRTSPLTGKGETFVTLGRKYGINPGVVCAIMQNETQLAADGSFLATNFNNFAGNTAGPDGSVHGTCGSKFHGDRWWKVFCTAEDGLEGVFQNLNTELYRNTGGRWEDIMMIYAPPDENRWDEMWSNFAAVGEQLGVPIGKDTIVYGTP